MSLAQKINLYRNYLHFLKHTLWLKVSSTHRVPLTVHIALTRKCPHRCLYCNYAGVKRPDRLTGENVAKILEEAYRSGTSRINFTGGEPVIHPDFDRVVQAASRLGFIVTVSTSGYQAEKHLEAFKKCSTVLLSLEGPAEVHARLCGESSAREVQRAMEVFSENGIRFWTTTLLTKLNLNQIDWIVDHARRYETFANFSLLEGRDEIGPDFHPASSDISGLLPSRDEHRAAIAHLIGLKKAGAPVGSSLLYLEELLRWPDYHRLWSPVPSKFYRCLAGRAACEISFDGTLYVCGWLIGRTTPISVLELGFPVAFQRLKQPQNCKSCASDCWLESNLIFNLNPRAIWNWVRKL